MEYIEPIQDLDKEQGSGLRMRSLWSASRQRDSVVKLIRCCSRVLVGSGADSLKCQHFDLILNPSIELIFFDFKIVSRLKIQPKAF